jgi:hypothetical protein
VWGPLAVILFGGTIWFSVYSGDYSIPLIFIALGALAGILFKSRTPIAGKILLSIFLVGASTMLLGSRAGKAAMTGPMPYTLEESDGKITGNFLRAGDKAVLFFNSDQKILELIKWSDIKRITRTRN